MENQTVMKENYSIIKTIARAMWGFGGFIWFFVSIYIAIYPEKAKELIGDKLIFIYSYIHPIGWILIGAFIFMVFVLREVYVHNKSKILTEKTGEHPHYSAGQINKGNISVQGNNNIITQNQQGGINAQKVVINNTINPPPSFELKEIFTNQPKQGKYHSQVQLTVITPFPLGNLYVEVQAPSIEDMDMTPMRAGGFMTGLQHAGNGRAFINVPSAYGNYLINIITGHPEKFSLFYEYE
jgi:hypothetical protein